MTGDDRMTKYYGLKGEYKQMGKICMKRTTRYRIATWIVELMIPKFIPLKWQVDIGLGMLYLFGFVEIKEK